MSRLAKVVSEAQKSSFPRNTHCPRCANWSCLKNTWEKNHVGTLEMVRQELLFTIFFWNTTVLRPISLCILLPRWEQDEIVLGSRGRAATLLTANVSQPQHKILHDLGRSSVIDSFTSMIKEQHRGLQSVAAIYANKEGGKLLCLSLDEKSNRNRIAMLEARAREALQQASSGCAAHLHGLFKVLWQQDI